MIKKLAYFIFSMVFLILILLMVLFPNQAFAASKNGLTIWFYNVLPSLLPFFIGTEILFGLGIVHFIGVLLEPIMYPLFKVPGIGSFAYIMSITSGYPMGTKITSDLRNQNLCTKEEGQRLLSFCSTSGPLFMIGAVAVGMFNNLYLGIILLLSHYAGSIATGLCFRFYGKSKEQLHTKKYTNPIKAMNRARKKDGRKFGILFGDAVRNSFNTLLVIGGFIIFFSVIIELFSTIKVFDFLIYIFSPVISLFKFSDTLFKGLIGGILEITNGAEIISKSCDTVLLKGTFLSFIIGWGGLSIHAQAISFISKTDLKIYPYIFAKILHGVFSTIIIFILIKMPLISFKNTLEQVFYSFEHTISLKIGWINKLLLSSAYYFCVMVIFLLFSIVLFSISKMKKNT